VIPRGRGWSLRRAIAEDAPSIARFHTACWVDAYRGIVPHAVLDAIDVEARTARWRRRLSEGRRTTAVAELPGTTPRLVGLVTWGSSHDLCEAEPPTLELASLYVARDLWGTGLADALVAHAIGDAPAQLWVYAANGRARAYYERRGFLPDGVEQVDEATGVWECRYARR